MWEQLEAFLSSPTGAFLTGILTREAWKWATMAGVVFLEIKVAKAKADGVEDWQDQVWAKLLKRLDKYRHERLEKQSDA